MAFQSNGPVMLALPPFRGFTRRIVLVAAAVFLATWVLSWVWPTGVAYLLDWSMLNPQALTHGMVWQTITYPFIDVGLLSVLFALISVWFFGSQVEDELGSRWLAEYFFTATIGGALVAAAISYAVGRWVPGLNVKVAYTSGMWPASMALLLAFAQRHKNEEIRFNFIFRLKAKYLMAIYVAGYVLLLILFASYRFSASVALGNMLCGWMFLQWVPRRGLRYMASEKLFGMRNDFYRAKRKRAAKEFEVYMRKQGKDVRVDDSHVDDSSDPNTKKWMN